MTDIISRLRSWRRHGRRTTEALPPGLATLYARAPLGIAAFSSEGLIVSANEALARMLGYAEAELRGRAMEEFTHRDDLDSCRELFDRVRRREQESFEMEKRFVRRDGSQVWARVIVAAVPGDGGAAPAAVGAAVDITEQKRAEEQVRRLNAELEERVAERTALLRAQQETSPDGVLVVDPQGRILSYNRRFTRMWGIPADVAARGSDREALAFVLDKLEDPEAFVARVAELYAAREKRSVDEVRLRDGRVFERYSSPISAPGGGRHYGRVWYFRDITRRMEHERLLRQKTAELQRSNADLEVYAYAASHDISAPLRKIILLGAVLERRAGHKLDEEERHMLARMRRGAEKLGSLIKELLALSLAGREAREPETVDLRAVIREVLEDFGPEIERCRAEVRLGRSLPRLKAHRLALYRLIGNLVANALKFHRESEPCKVRIECREAEGGVEIVVSDNGIGFEPRFAEKIFEPFSRLHAPGSFEGHGIGLAVCQRVVARYGGRIRADGMPGRGSVFTVWLPESILVR